MGESLDAAKSEFIKQEQLRRIDPARLESAVLAEQVRILYATPSVLLVNVFNAALSGYLLRYFYPAWLVIAWVGLIVVVVLARLYGWWCYRREPRPAETALIWARRYTIGAIATGSLWGLASSALLLTPDPVYHAFIAFVIGGMTAGAVTINSSYLPAMIGFAAPALVPAILTFFSRGNLMSVSMGLMAAAFAVVVGFLSRRANHWISSIVQREILQAALTVDLQEEIAERKQIEKEMVHVLHTDLLTGLPNRRAFMDWIEKAFATAKGASTPFAIMYLDLDRFKDVNETLGHSVGDELLKAVAERVAGVLRNGALIARVGGDEFGIFSSQFESREAMTELAREIIQLMASQYVIEGSEIHISVSIGISVYRTEMIRPEEMMREADLALYEAKDSGHNRFLFYSEAHDRAVHERVTLMQELNAALDRREFEVYYQPQVEWPSGRITGLEALLRWNHPRRGLVLPGVFIPLAERIGLIIPLGQWVLSNVCRQLRIWHGERIGPIIASVNVSAGQLISPSEFDRELTRELGVDGLDPAMIELELTETALMECTRESADVLDRLRALGVRIAIDDFGTGYSSLEYLLTYRVNRIKIAQQFVRGLPGDAISATIVHATIGLAREFGFEIIAEGVETADQLDFLVKSGCQNIQGYYFSRPVRAEQAGELLRQGFLSPRTDAEL